MGIRESGNYEILGFYMNPVENHVAYRNVLMDLHQRGVEEPLLFIADGLPGIEEEVRQIYPGADFQLCTIHASRNFETHVRVQDRNEIDNDLDLSMKEILAMYKYQPHLERRHEQIKSVYAVAPVMLKNVYRIESLLFVYFLALLIESLIEHEARNSIKKGKRKSIRIYPELRSCESPTTDCVLGDFAMVQMNWIESSGKVVKQLLPKLTQRQENLIRLAGVPVS